MIKHIGVAICPKGTQLEKLKSDEFSGEPGLSCLRFSRRVCGGGGEEEGKKNKMKQMKRFTFFDYTVITPLHYLLYIRACYHHLRR